MGRFQSGVARRRMILTRREAGKQNRVESRLHVDAVVFVLVVASCLDEALRKMLDMRKSFDHHRKGVELSFICFLGF